MKHRTDNHAADRRAFMLKDLVAIAAAVSLIAAVQLPLLARNEEGSSSATCRNNLRHLAQAWLMYAEDNAGELVPNHGNVVHRQTWATGWLDYTTSGDSTNQTYLVNPELHASMTGLLGPYLQRNPRYFRCPSDRSTTIINGREHSRVRSVSMNSWMGGNAYCGQGANYMEYRQLSEVVAPSKRWVIVEERPDSIGDSWHAVRMHEEYLVDYPGFFHSMGSWITFADGHVEHRRWTDPRTIPTYSVNELLPLNVPHPGSQDMAWLKERTTDPIP